MANAKLAPNIYTYRPQLYSIDCDSSQELPTILDTEASGVSLKNSKHRVLKRPLPNESQPRLTTNDSLPAMPSIERFTHNEYLTTLNEDRHPRSLSKHQPKSKKRVMNTEGSTSLPMLER